MAVPISLNSGQQHFRQQDISDQRNTRQTHKETCILPQGIKHVHNAESFEASMTYIAIFLAESMKLKAFTREQ